MCGEPDTKIDPTPEEAMAVQKDLEIWNYYQDNYKPLIDKWIQVETSPERIEEEKKAVGGEVKGEMMKQIDPSKVSTNPVENTRRMAALARMTSTAEEKGREAERGRTLGSLEDIIQVGRGEETGAMESMQQLADVATGKAIAEKQLSVEKQIAKQQAQQKLGSSFLPTMG